MPARKKESTRSETVTVRLDPKIHYLAGIGAREQQRTLSSFIECSVRRALTVEAMNENEATPGTEFVFKEAKPLYNDALWDVDSADRFFKLATSHPELLTISEQRLWKLFDMHMEHIGTPITVKAFREFWNSPDINTSHLRESGDK